MNFKRVEVSRRRGPKLYINVNFDTEGVIRVKNDKDLEDAINEYGGYKVANECRYMYNRIHGKRIDIYADSMAIELYGHIWPDKLLKAILKVPLLPSKFVDKCNETLKRTAIIDCGEKGCDENRDFWDTLVDDKFYRNFRDFI